MRENTPGTQLRAGTLFFTGGWLLVETVLTMIMIFSNNQSLLIMEVSPTDSGKYKCVAQSPTGQTLQHTTILTSFPAPVFSHTPIWNKRPASTRVRRGSKAVLECSATVGQQYNTVSTEPIQAAWTRYCI